MRTTFTSRTATKVKDGKVQPKNRNRPTCHQGYVIDRESVGRGFLHVVSKSDVQRFIDLIPEWERYSERLERILLAGPCYGTDGLYKFYRREETGAIFLNAWSEDLWIEMPIGYFTDHLIIFQRIGVRHDIALTTATCYFTLAQARAFALLHVFLHELGHHFDRIHQKHLDASRGEEYAENFANSRLDVMFPRYVEAFGDPRR